MSNSRPVRRKMINAKRVRQAVELACVAGAFILAAPGVVHAAEPPSEQPVIVAPDYQATKSLNDDRPEQEIDVHPISNASYSVTGGWGETTATIGQVVDTGIAMPITPHGGSNW